MSHTHVDILEMLVCPHSTQLVTSRVMTEKWRNIFGVISVRRKKWGGGVFRLGGKQKTEIKMKQNSGWAHHISTQPLLYVIHDRILTDDTLHGSQTATERGQQCHSIKIYPTKNTMKTFLKWTTDATKWRIIKKNVENLNRNECLWGLCPICRRILWTPAVLHE